MDCKLVCLFFFFPQECLKEPLSLSVLPCGAVFTQLLSSSFAFKASLPFQMFKSLFLSFKSLQFLLAIVTCTISFIIIR